MTEGWDAASDGPVRPAPQGARANAVPPPAAWTALVEVDHRVSQALLDSLEDAAVAAYAEPQAQTAPVDRIHVDATRRDVAEAIVAAELPGLLAELGPAEAEVDPFDAIVAAWDAVPEAATWPDAENVRPARRADPPPEPPAPKRRNPDDDHFVPPPAPPVTLPSAPVTRYAIVAIVLGIVVIVVLPLLGQTQDDGIQILGLISLLAGIGTLVFRMRDAPSVDDGPDDGAVL
ncbi:MAG TPA: hypothetical protein VNQ77_08910 [Frankiaceae bacterium]|nr:hypothetical protein [Frankiaceae bacterium]